MRSGSLGVLARRGEAGETGRPGLLMSQYVSVSGHLRKMRRRYSIIPFYLFLRWSGLVVLVVWRTWSCWGWMTVVDRLVVRTET